MTCSECGYEGSETQFDITEDKNTLVCPKCWSFVDGNFQEFLDAYITAALWSSQNIDNDDEEFLDENYSRYDLSEETLKSMSDDCTKFLSESREIINNAIKEGTVKFGPDFGPYGRAGHDFWLTRQRHGSGFWDNDWADIDGDILTEMAHRFGEQDLYVSDGKIYIN